MSPVKVSPGVYRYMRDELDAGCFSKCEPEEVLWFKNVPALIEEVTDEYVQVQLPSGPVMDVTGGRAVA